MKTSGLLPQELLVRTSELDQAEWSFSKGVLGWVSRERFSLVTRTLAGLRGLHGLDVLEIGYGGGLFLPELSKHALHLYGVDVHGHPQEVMDALSQVGVQADLRQAPAEELPFDDDSMDLVVTVSAMEFVDDIQRCAAEVARVLRPGGHVVVVTPGSSKILDTGLKILTGEDAEDTFKGRRGTVLPAFSTVLTPVATSSLPPKAVPLVPRLYTCGLFKSAK